MFKNITVIAADIDCTLTTLDHKVTEKTINSIKQLRNNGFLFGLASGRPYQDIMNKYQLWGLDKQFDFIIGWNGGQLYDDKTKRVYTYNYLSKEDIKEIIEFMKPFDCTVNMYDEDDIYLSSKETDRAWYSAFKNKRQFVVCEDMSRYYQHDNGGIMFRTTNELMPLIEEKSEEFTKGKDYVGFKTQTDLMEFSHKNCNKGYALSKYCDLYNISLDNCMAFGDTTNDNEMLKICNGVCLLNGSEDTKKCAKIITDFDCDHDGFADFVNKHLLG